MVTLEVVVAIVLDVGRAFGGDGAVKGDVGSGGYNSVRCR